MFRNGFLGTHKFPIFHILKDLTIPHSTEQEGDLLLKKRSPPRLHPNKEANSVPQSDNRDVMGIIPSKG